MPDINEFAATDFLSPVRVDGVDITTGITTSGHLARALPGIMGVAPDASGIIGGTAFLAVAAQASPNLTVKISSGAALIAGALTSSAAVASLSGFAAPSANPRKDIVQIATTGVITRKAGTEHASPTAPSPDANNITLAEVYNRVGQTSIKDTDDASNGYITIAEGKHL